MLQNKPLLISVGANIILLALAIWYMRKPAQVITKVDKTLDKYLIERNQQLEREKSAMEYEFQLINDAINQDSAFIWDANRIRRDSIRAALNPK